MPMPDIEEVFTKVVPKSHRALRIGVAALIVLIFVLLGVLFWLVHANSEVAARNAAIARSRGQALGTANAKLTQNGIPAVQPTHEKATPGKTDVGPTTPSSTPPPVQGERGETGATGAHGVGITHVGVKSGDLIVDMSDGSTLNAGHVVGQPGPSGKPGSDGKNGDDGRGITGTTISDGALVVSYTDGTSKVLGEVVGPQGKPGASGAPGTGVPGKDGSDGKDGAPGQDGRSVTGVDVSADYHLIVSYSDGTTSDAGKLPPGPAGPAGPAGKDGSDGKDGRGIKSTKCTNGEWTITYTDGTTEDGGSCVATSTVTVTAPPSTTTSPAPTTTAP